MEKFTINQKGAERLEIEYDEMNQTIINIEKTDPKFVKLPFKKKDLNSSTFLALNDVILNFITSFRVWMEGVNFKN